MRSRQLLPAQHEVGTDRLAVARGRADGDVFRDASQGVDHEAVHDPTAPALVTDDRRPTRRRLRGHAAVIDIDFVGSARMRRDYEVARSGQWGDTLEVGTT